MKRLLFLFLITLICYGCGKSNLIKESLKSCKISGKAYDNNDLLLGSGTIEFEESKVRSITSTQDTAFMSFSTIYAADQITLKTKYFGNWVYKFDSQKRITGVDLYNGITTFKFTYNSNNQLLTARKKEFDWITNYAFFYENGNLTKVTGNMPVEATDFTIEYQYSQDLNAALISKTDPLYYIGATEVIPGFFGVSNRNQLISIKETATNRNNYANSITGQINVYELTYTKDKDQNVTKLLAFQKNYGYTAGINSKPNWTYKTSYEFKYDCK